MCIDTAHLVRKIESAPTKPYADQIYQAVEEFCGLIERNEPAKKVGCYFDSITQTLSEDEEPYFVLDSLRMAFFRFASGGLRDLYVYQENESWYPRILLREVLEPNDIESLEDVFMIYRGCDRSELDSSAYGQSWTKSREVAEKFAFQHYSSQEWFVERNRVVLQATCLRENVLFSDQTEYGEFEVVVVAETVADVHTAA